MKSGVKTFMAVVIISAGLCLALFSVITADESPGINPSTPSPDVKPVKVTVVEKEPTQVWKTFSARLEAVNYVKLRPQVSGTIVKVNFEDGQNVDEGDVVFVIDPEPFIAAVARAKSALNSALANHEFAKQQYRRAQNLIKTDAIAKSIYDQRKNAYESTQAEIQSARAELKRVSIDLDRAYVKAPITGRLGQIEITRGNLVDSAQNPPVLTTIVSQDYIYADFEVDEQTYLQYIRSFAKNKEAEKNIPVKLRLSEDTMVYDGTIYTFDNQLDVTSGTIRARALFENSDNVLLPGMFAQVEMGSAEVQDRVFIDERAIGTDQDRRFVYIVDKDNTVAYRELRLGISTQGKREVLSGLNDGDKVIIDGIMFMRAGMKVKPIITTEPLSTHLDSSDQFSS